MTKHMPRYLAVAAATFAVAVTALVASLLVTGSASAGPASPSKTAQGGVPAKAQAGDPAYWAAVNFQGTLYQHSPVFGTTASRIGTGRYRVHFGPDVANCARVATIGLPKSAGTMVFGEIITRLDPSSSHNVDVWTANSQGHLANRSFSLVLEC
jgi:hypothetical protein